MSSPVSHPPKPGKSCHARNLALQVLRDIHHHQTHADQALDTWLKKVSVSASDRALAHDLVYGVLRHRDTLDWRLNLVAHRPVLRFPLPVLLALRLGAYQLLYLDKIPESAAVNESVKLVKGLGGRDWKSLVNAILRNLSRQTSPPPWPDITEHPIPALSVRYSCPPWLVERWIARLGLERAEQAFRSMVLIPPLTLRTNTLRCSREELEQRLRDDGFHPHLTPVSPFGLVVEKCGPLTKMSPLQEGWCYVEDEAAQLVPLLLDVQPEHRVWDACAAPGGKTTHLAELMKNQGDIVATDSHARRLNLLTENAQRLGVSIITSFTLDIMKMEEVSHPHFRQGFDRILLDVPCSGLGTLRRHPEAKWFKHPEHLARHHENQRRILDQVCNHLRPGGVLVYSACSVELEESDQVISEFLRDHPEYDHEVATPWLPSSARSLVNQDGNLMTLGTDYDMDGFFATRLRKKGSS